ncbi:hypothetical protein KAJ02_05235 [Candidatus Bipolaricaulota bacterium]|nr:hypothetical protein [Candidatus Bipolaricaulota bacterium]
MPSRQEISDLLAIVDIDLKDAGIPELSAERKLSCCYNAMLTAAHAALRVSGYRVPKSNQSHHYYAIQSLRHTVEFDADTALRIEAVQKKRNVADYVRIGEVSESVAAETLALAEDVCGRVREWLIEHHPNLTAE